MLRSYQFASTPHVLFGIGEINNLPNLLSSFGKEVLIVTGRKSFLKSKHWGALKTKLSERGIKWHQYTVKGEPTPETIDLCVRKMADFPLSCVVAIGGGSVLDAGKAIAAMWGKKKSVQDYLEGVGSRKPDGTKLPFIAVPTTAGTGSEATKNAVISQVGKGGFKKSLRHDLYVPNYALIDPELALGTPAAITARCGMDAFTQLLEAYLSTNASPMTDLVAWEGLRFIKRSLIRAYREGRDLDARTDMAYAALLSGIALANAGLGTVHGFASSVGGRFAIPHGVVCATLMGPVNRKTLSKLSKSKVAFDKYAKVGDLFSKKIGKSRKYYARFLIELIEEWTELMEIPRLGTFGVRAKDLPAIAEKTGNKYNPVSLNLEERLAVLKERL